MRATGRRRAPTAFATPELFGEIADCREYPDQCHAFLLGEFGAPDFEQQDCARFAAEMGNRRDETGARLADDRTRAFFAKHLA